MMFAQTELFHSGEGESEMMITCCESNVKYENREKAINLGVCFFIH